MINFQICGNLGKDAELNENLENSASQSSLIEFPIYSRQYNGESGIYNMQLWTKKEAKKKINLILDNFTKGTQVTCFGTIEQQKYQDRETNQKKIKTIFKVNNFELPPQKSRNFNDDIEKSNELIPF